MWEPTPRRQRIAERHARIGPRLAMAGLVLLAGSVGCARPSDGSRSAPANSDQAATPEQTAGGDTSAPVVDPCGLVSKQEAEGLAGTPLNDAVAVPGSCTYSGPVDGPLAQVEVYVGDGAKKYLDIQRNLGHELRPLAGMGHEAYSDVENSSVFFQKSGLWVAIHLVLLNDPEENAGPLEELARVVVDRI